MADEHRDGHGSGHSHGGGDARALALSLGLVLIVLVAELIGSWLSGSLALLSDAAHPFTVAAALGIALAAAHHAQRPPDARRSYGYSRFEVLAALVNAPLPMLVAAGIVWQAWRRLDQRPQIESALMRWIAAPGLAANLAGMWLLRQRRGRNLNLQGAWLEAFSDTLGSVGVIGAALAIQATARQWIDSAVAVAIGLWMLPRSWRLLRASLKVLPEGVPDRIEVAGVERSLCRERGVAGVHDLHVWAIASGWPSLSAHVVVAAGAPLDGPLLPRLRRKLHQRIDIAHSTIQLEREPCRQPRGGEPAATPPASARPAATGDSR